MAAVPSKVPWDDLRYLFGEIIYGGHITDDWDRRLCRTYLAEYIRAEMLEGEILLAPGFQIPLNLDYKVRRAPSRDGGTRETRAPSGRQSNRGVLARGLPGEGLRHRPYGQTLQEEASGQATHKEGLRGSLHKAGGETPSLQWGGSPNRGLAQRARGGRKVLGNEASYEDDAGSSSRGSPCSPSPPFAGIPRIHR